MDLYQTIGEEAFQAGFLDLYLASQEEDEADGLEETSVNIEHLKGAFGADDEIVNTVIRRWYDGSAPYDLSRLDTAPTDQSLPGINGRVNQVYVVTAVNKPPVSEFSAQETSGWILLAMEFSYQVFSIQVEQELEIVEYYEDGFEFYRQVQSMTAHAAYIGQTYYFRVGLPEGEWAVGRYYVFVYDGDRKVAHVEYEVTP